MEVMYELITDERSFEEFLIDYGAIYTSTTTSNVQVSYGNLKPNDYIVFPYDPTNICLEDLQTLLTYYEELEQYEKCMVIKQRIDAKKIKFDQKSQFWRLSNYSIRKFEGGIETNVQFSEKDTLIDLSFTPEDINKQARSPDELDYYELTSRIVDLKENGVKTVKWEVTRYLKVSFSLTNFIVVLCGIPLVVFREKNSLSFGIGMSVFVIFGYYAFIKFGQSMGFKGQLSPILSAWIGNIIFLIGGMTLLIKARK